MSATFARRECPVCGNWDGSAITIAWLESPIIEQIAWIVDHYR
jgi:hypothetical protein